MGGEGEEGGGGGVRAWAGPGGGGGGGGCSKKVLYGEVQSRGSTPYPFVSHFDRKGTPFRILLIEKRHPFHMLS